MCSGRRDSCGPNTSPTRSERSTWCFPGCAPSPKCCGRRARSGTTWTSSDGSPHISSGWRCWTCITGRSRTERFGMTTLHGIDYAVMLLYFGFVLGIGAMLRRYVRDGVRGPVHDAVLLRFARALGPGVLEAPLRRKDQGPERDRVRHHDGVLLRHFAVRHGQAAQPAARVELRPE